MPVNTEFNKRKCWACQHFNGNRKFNGGIVGDSVITDSDGACGNRSSLKYGKKIGINYSCSKFSRWTKLDLTIPNQEKTEIVPFKFTDTKLGRFIASPIGITLIIYCVLFLSILISLTILTNININKYNELIDAYVNNGGSYLDQYTQTLSDKRAPYVILQYVMPVILIVLTIAFVVAIILIKKKQKKEKEEI